MGPKAPVSEADLFRHPPREQINLKHPLVRLADLIDWERLAINGLYKAELIHRRAPWKCRESVELATLQWVHWFNHIRVLEPIGYIPPAEAEANYWRQLANETIAAVST